MSDREKWLEAAVLRLQDAIRLTLSYGSGTAGPGVLRQALSDTELVTGRLDGQLCPPPGGRE